MGDAFPARRADADLAAWVDEVVALAGDDEDLMRAFLALLRAVEQVISLATPTG